MTQATLPLSTQTAKITLTDRLAAYFRVRAGEWINARDLLTVAGFAGWRTRVSNLRYPPYNMVIENRTRRVRVRDEGGMVAISEARGWTVSEYRHVPDGH